MCSGTDGTDAYAYAKKIGRFRLIKRTEGVSSTDIVGRMLMCTRVNPKLRQVDTSHDIVTDNIMTPCSCCRLAGSQWQVRSRWLAPGIHTKVRLHRMQDNMALARKFSSQRSNSNAGAAAAAAAKVQSLHMRHCGWGNQG